MSEQTWKVPLSDVTLRPELSEAAADVVASGWWSMGPKVAEFEAAFAEEIDVRHAYAVANGTAALHLALLALDCGPGDEVIVPSLTFVAAANTIRRVGATPVFCDIVGDGDLNLDPEDLARARSPSTRAIVVLHYGGFACDMGAVLKLARQAGIAVIEDAAHAPGSRWDARFCGAIGDVGCFSFFSNKNLPVGEGGMIVTDRADVADRTRLLRSHGMTTLTWDRHRGHASTYDVVVPGLNYRLDEMRAAMGLVQLGFLAEENAARARLARAYADALHGVNGYTMAFADRLGEPTSAHHLAVALAPDPESRDDIRARLAERRIQTSVHYPPIHRFSAYQGIQPSRALPRTEDAAARAITLPLFARMTDADVDLVVDALLER
ncbi:MAG TPA: DegT/DnrJ/EryC1/StrS family aminotransferase [Gaiellaceae bacterium]|nr:DegT/DnrJ/EryC1/StrS family aminotransferase [Gaiellaceae bacterium]